MKVSCSRLAINISRRLASCCAEQPAVSIGGSVPRYIELEKKGAAYTESKNANSNQ